MNLQNGDMMMVESKVKNCKVIATYFGTRRHYPHNYKDTIDVLKDSIGNEKELDPGVTNLDVIIVNHDCGNKEGKKFLNSVNNTKTFCGRIRVLHRDWEDGKGISLGSFCPSPSRVTIVSNFEFFIPVWIE